MLHNYLTIALRNLLRHKGYACINVGGLAVGMACCILILLYVQYELGYDRFHEKADRIYRVVKEERLPGRVVHLAAAPSPLVPAMLQDMPEVEAAVRIKPPNAAWMLRYEDNGFYETGFYLADPGVFEVFSIPLVQGDPKTALQRPFTLVLTEEAARRYFGDENPIGKVIRGEERVDFEVTGIMKPLPRNSHLKFDILASMGTQEKMNSYHLTSWVNTFKFYTYVLLPPGYNPGLLERKFPALLEKYAGEAFRNASVTMILSLQPLTAIHLYSHLEGELSPNSDIGSIYLFSAIAVFILLIACINFINLSVARSTMRAKEVGVRKVLGADRLHLIRQFLGESVLLSCLSILLAVALVKLCLPTFNAIAEKDIVFHLTDNAPAVGGIVAIALFVGLVSGAYPAFVLSSFPPASVMSRMRRSGPGGMSFRRALVVLQFTISIALLICTGIVAGQLSLLRSKKLGLNPDQLVIIPMTDRPMQEKYEAYKRDLLQYASMRGVTAANFAPGRLNNLRSNTYRSPDAAMGEPVQVTTLGVDPDFPNVMQIDLAAGRFLKPLTGGAVPTEYVINETAARRFGWNTPEEAVGKRIERLQQRQGETAQWYPYTIVGVVKDFHIRSLHDPIEATVLGWSNFGPYIYAKIAPADVAETVKILQDTWRRVQGKAPFEYRFMDEEFAKLYSAEAQLGQIFGSFALLAVVIGCLGLFGLASFTVTQRTKEIGIRKVLGASIPNLIRLISKEFLLLVALSNLIAWPVAYYAMSRWLQNFAYRIDMSAGVFVLAAVMALAVALATVGGHALRAARTNPVEALRYE